MIMCNEIIQQKINFDVDLEKSAVTMRIGNAEFQFWPRYGHAINDLIDAAYYLKYKPQEGDNYYQFNCDDIWISFVKNDDDLHIVVQREAGIDAQLVDGDIMIMDAHTTYSDFCHAIVNAVMNVLSKYGISGYRKNWDDYGHKFPIVELLSLLGAKTENDNGIYKSNLTEELGLLMNYKY